MSAWEQGRQDAQARARLSAAEAELLGEDPEVHGLRRELADVLRGLDVAEQQYLTVRLRLLGPDAYGYEPADLERAETDLRFARGVVNDTVQRLAEALARQTEEQS